jgi:hypothetical protein
MSNLLPTDWLTRTGIDRELHRYLVLAFVQRVRARFGERKLYPYLNEVQERAQELEGLVASMERAVRALPREVTGFDLENGQVCYREPNEDEWMRTITDSVGFARPRITELLEHGDGLRKELGARIHFEPVGLLPLNTREGYLLLREAREARVYAYALPFCCTPNQDLQPDLRTRYITSYTLSLTCNYEHIKTDLVRNARHLPNPAAFVFESDLPMPRIETYLPLAKQLVRQAVLSTAA